MRFSRVEITELIKAWFVITIAVAIVTSGKVELGILLLNFVIAAFTVGIGFVVHELAHKFMAQKYNCFAEFRADNKMLVISLISAFFGFVFAAPGAVMIWGRIDTEKNGKISLAGPLSNLVIAGAFFLVAFTGTSWVQVVATFGYKINGWLALFNLIPIGGLDGSKILAWNKLVYGMCVAAAIPFFFL